MTTKVIVLELEYVFRAAPTAADFEIVILTENLFLMNSPIQLEC